MGIYGGGKRYRFKFLNDDGERAMRSIAQLLGMKGRDIWSIGPGASVFEAITLLAEKEVGALLVLDGGKLVGVVSERDYARKVILKGRSSREMRVSEIMTRLVHTIGPEQSVAQGLELMTEKRVRHLPVVAAGDLLGVVSIGDLVKEIIAEQKVTIEQLQQYISG